MAGVRAELSGELRAWGRNRKRCGLDESLLLEAAGDLESLSRDVERYRAALVEIESDPLGSHGARALARAVLKPAEES